MSKKSFAKSYGSSVLFDESPFFRKREYLSTEKTEFEGKSLTQSVYVVDDPKTRYNGLKASDFALENLLESGLEQKLVKCSLNSSEIEEQIKNALNK